MGSRTGIVPQRGLKRLSEYDRRGRTTPAISEPALEEFGATFTAAGIHPQHARKPIMARGYTPFQVLVSAWILQAGSAHAAQPPDVVVSDRLQNTAMGSDALHSLNSLVQGIGNTAAGAQALYSNTTGDENTAVGAYALLYNTTGSVNIAVGNYALLDNTLGDFNIAFGYSALQENTTGSGNTALGSSAMQVNKRGFDNTATGYEALHDNTSGYYNTASGYQALRANTTAVGNSAFGYQALFSNATGTGQTASGYKALFSNTTGIENVGTGSFALYANTTGNFNTAEGHEALLHNTLGASNTALGHDALLSNTSGSYNIALGDGAGYNLTVGSNNIDIGNQGFAGESGTIRIGAPSTQGAAYIAGINNSRLTGSAVYVSADGQLGVLASSERYKIAVAPIGGPRAGKLQQLRPVTFHLKAEPDGAVQYGLIAEEVETVYPELVIRDDAGQIQGVRYDELAPLLLVEIQQQQRKLTAQAARIDVEEGALRDMQHQMAELKDLNASMQRALRALMDGGGGTARR
jgi:trimeric autotransporter adhesin